MQNMTINKKSEGEKLTLTLSGRLDTNTSPALEAELKHSVDGVKELIFDFSDVEYISSAGLRIEGHEPPGQHEADRRKRRCHGSF